MAMRHSSTAPKSASLSIFPAAAPIPSPPRSSAPATTLPPPRDSPPSCPRDPRPTKPGAPKGWQHAPNKHLVRHETSKSAALGVLVDLGVKPAALAPLKKVALEELQQLIDNSSEDESTVIDDKRLVSKRKKNQLVFPTNGQDGIEEITLTLTREGSRIQYNFSVDWSKEWIKREEAAQNVIHKAGFIIYKGDF